MAREFKILLVLLQMAAERGKMMGQPFLNLSRRNFLSK